MRLSSQIVLKSHSNLRLLVNNDLLEVSSSQETAGKSYRLFQHKHLFKALLCSFMQSPSLMHFIFIKNIIDGKKIFILSELLQYSISILLHCTF